MGLDMQAVYAKPREAGTPDSEFKGFHNWRKHSVFNDWMGNRFGKDHTEEDYAYRFTIGLSDLDILEKDIVAGKLPYELDPTADFASDDREFIQKARAFLSQGYEVRYWSNW